MKLLPIIATLCFMSTSSLASNDSYTPTVKISDIYISSGSLNCFFSFKIPKSMGYIASRFSYFNQKLPQSISVNIKGVTHSPIKATVGTLLPVNPDHTDEAYNISLTMHTRPNKIFAHLQPGKYELDLNGFVELYVGKNIDSTPYVSIEKKASTFSNKIHGASYEWSSKNEILISWNSTFFADAKSVKFYTKDKTPIEGITYAGTSINDSGQKCKFIIPESANAQFIKIQYINKPLSILKIPISASSKTIQIQQFN